jgi:hypothetical protein
MSSVRSVERRRSRSETGRDKVAVEARLIDVEAVSRDNRSLRKLLNVVLSGSSVPTYPLERLLARVELLALPGAVSM